jgi:hypothetical protein
VVCLAIVAGLAAWVATKGGTPIYERTVSSVVVPKSKSGLSQVPTSVDASIAGGIGSKLMLTDTLRRLGYTPDSASKYSLRAFVRPGSDFIDAKLRGPDVSVLAALGHAYVRTSRQWTAQRYGTIYNLNFVETVPTPGRVAPHPKRTAGLGFVLGGLLGLLILYAESQARARRSGRPGASVLEISDGDSQRHGDADTVERDDEQIRQLGRQPVSRRRGRRAGGRRH